MTVEKNAKPEKTAQNIQQGYEGLNRKANEDYLDRTTARALLAGLNGDRIYQPRGGLGAAPEALDLENALGKNADAAGTNLQALTGTVESLQAQREAHAAGIAARMGQTEQELQTAAARRRDENALSDARRQAELAREDTLRTQKQTQQNQDFQRRLGLLCLEQGIMPTKEMLTAMGIDEATAKSYVNVYWDYLGRYV